MARIFTIACPKCKKEFEVHYGDLRHKEVKLHCPYCDNWFFQTESEKIDDRWFLSFLWFLWSAWSIWSI